MTYRKIAIVLASPGKVTKVSAQDCFENEDSTNKEKHPLRKFAVLQSEKLLKEIPPYLNRDF